MHSWFVLNASKMTVVFFPENIWLMEPVMIKSKQSNIKLQLILSFSALILIFFVFGAFALYDIHRVSELSRTIYSHPLVVSNAALQANVSIARMHRSMKDVVLFNSSSRIQQAIEAVNKGEEQVYHQLNIVKDNILGEEGKSFEDATRKLFDEWRMIRNKVIGLVHDDQRKNAAEITIGKGANHVTLLETKMLKLTNYARNKASKFNLETERIRSRWNLVLSFFWALGIIIFLLVSFFTLKFTLLSEKKLQKSEERYRSLIENQTDLVCRFMPDGEFIFVNDMYAQFFNKSKKELIGSKWKPRPVDDDVEFIKEKLSKLSSTNPTITIENRVLSGKKKIHWMQFIHHGFFDHRGRLLEIQSVGRDNTERKQAEEMLLEQEKLQGVLEMAGAICHELSQPLQAVSGSSEILLLDIKSSDPNYKTLIDIEVNIKRMAILMHKIMGITRYQSKPYLRSKIVDIEQASQDEKGIDFS